MTQSILPFRHLGTSRNHQRYHAIRPGLRLASVWGHPHMHKLGTSIDITRATSDGQEECLMKIPDWDFNLKGFTHLKNRWS